MKQNHLVLSFWGQQIGQRFQSQSFVTVMKDLNRDGRQRHGADHCSFSVRTALHPALLPDFPFALDKA